MTVMTTISPPTAGLAPLTDFITALGALVEVAPDEAHLLDRGAALLGDLIAQNGWLPDAYAEPSAVRYQQYPLHIDPAGRFSVVSFVWGPGQVTPVHDHRVWGLVGVLRGAELAQSFAFDAEGALRSTGPAHRLGAGSVDAVSPRIGDIHRVANAHDDRVSISIHVYGADIGRVERATYDHNGAPKPFVSGYADLPALIV
jgi:predicted metal-dependent enzyme (double-stranded beta helix superfamily)